EKPKKSQSSKFEISDLQLNQPKKEYIAALKKIKRYLEIGDTYQVNYTQKLKFHFSGAPLEFYEILKKNQSVDYAAFLDFDDLIIISLSPELFFKRSNNKIILKPMKGTIKRGINVFEDLELQNKLLYSEKERAENLMIVDLIRNDIGKICKIGAVRVPHLFLVEKYNTIFQMTSTITGNLKKNISYFDIFKALFPCGSVTGAPKFRVMQIIYELEKELRNVYCGAIGIIFPKKRAVFNVAIRTIQIKDNCAELGIGSGITIDSITENEYSEMLLKSKFLQNISSAQNYDFELIETMLYKNKYYFLNDHLKRLKLSAQYFDFKFSKSEIIQKLLELSQKFEKNTAFKIRILLAKDGRLKIEFQKLEMLDTEKKITISKIKTNSSNIFLYHKTTNRQLYNNEYQKYSKLGFYDIVFLNEKAEITEASFNNIVIEKNGKLLTPALKCGLLPGIYRNKLLTQKKIKESIIKIEDLKKSEKFFLCNSVRGLVTVKFVDL
ncbi:MAG TPA: aminodeoxychorismate synthase component I, partial [bacterium]|nr:aminodeoxychorismate synthase component I [bacterium]